MKLMILFYKAPSMTAHISNYSVKNSEDIINFDLDTKL